MSETVEALDLPPTSVNNESRFGTPMNAGASMMRGADIGHFAERHGMPIPTIEELVAWRSR